MVRYFATVFLLTGGLALIMFLLLKGDYLVRGKVIGLAVLVAWILNPGSFILFWILVKKKSNWQFIYVSTTFLGRFIGFCIFLVCTLKLTDFGIGNIVGAFLGFHFLLFTHENIAVFWHLGKTNPKRGKRDFK